MARATRLLVFVLLAFAALPARAEAESAAADSLRQAYEELQPKLRGNAFDRPLHLDSREGASQLKGDIHAVVDHPFERVSESLGRPEGWCDVLILQFNTKRCEPTQDEPGLVINIGRKHDQPIDKTVQVQFPFRVMSASPEYFSVILNAATGPYGTRDYRILLEAVPLDPDRTFLHMSYSYGFGMTAKLAMNTYLATRGRSKIGFTVVDRDADGDPVHVGGVRGMIERNTMRYFLAIESFLGSLSEPPEARVDKRLNDWIEAVERYPRQLHEMEREDYLAMKRKEIRRQDG
jgi:hypothetical protein